jgi:hypothetical protein
MLTPLFYLFDHSNLYSRLGFIGKIKNKKKHQTKTSHYTFWFHLCFFFFFYLPFTFTLRWNCGRDLWLWMRPCQYQARGRRCLFHMVLCHKSHAQNIVTCTREILNIFCMILLIGILYHDDWNNLWRSHGDGITNKIILYETHRPRPGLLVSFSAEPGGWHLHLYLGTYWPVKQ